MKGVYYFLKTHRPQQKTRRIICKFDLPPTLADTDCLQTVDSLFQDVEGKSLVKSILDLRSFFAVGHWIALIIHAEIILPINIYSS